MVKYPADWKVLSVAECADIFQGGTPKTSNKTYWNGDIIWVTPSDISRIESLYINNSERKITELGLAKSSAVLLPKGTILFCSRATIGFLAIAAKPMATNQGFKNLVCKNNVHNEYLARSLTRSKDEIISKAIGTTFLEISKKELSKIEIGIPSFEKQKSISRVLSTLDTYIEDLTALIAKKKDIRDGALEDLVSGRTRLEGFTGEWKEVSFAEVITPKARIGWQGLKKYEYLHRGYSYLIGGTDFSAGTVNLSHIWFVSQERYDMDTNIQVAKDDVLVTKDGTIGKVALVPQLDKPATLNSGVFVFRTTSELLQVFLYRILLSSIFNTFISLLSAGSTIKHLYQKDLKKFTFQIPTDIAEQQAIADTLTAMDEEIQQLEAKRDKMKGIRDGAMDELLTGRIRLDQ